MRSPKNKILSAIDGLNYRQAAYSLLAALQALVDSSNNDPEVAGVIRSMVGEAMRSDGSSADYYQLPAGATQLQDLISHRDMNAQLGEIFRAAYRYGMASHSDRLRDAKKIAFYAQAEIERLEAANGD